LRLRSRFASSCVFLILVGCASSAPASHDGSQGSARNRASFDVEALREVANDWVTARLSVVSEGKDPSEIAKTVNETMAKAIEAAKRVPDVTVQSAAYVTQPVYDEGKVVRWRARQELRLESGDVDRLAKLIGRLQGESVQLSNIDFSVRRETRKALEDELIEEALGRFRSRATLVAKGMGSNNWSLIELSVGSSDGEPRRVMMEHRPSAMLSRSQSDTPVFEAGTSKLRVRVSGIVELD
jgi:predicted secreted protein